MASIRQDRVIFGKVFSAVKSSWSPALSSVLVARVGQSWGIRGTLRSCYEHARVRLTSRVGLDRDFDVLTEE